MKTSLLKRTYEVLIRMIRRKTGHIRVGIERRRIERGERAHPLEQLRVIK